MFLFKRDGYYHLEYFDEIENRTRRISTKSKTKPQALKFLSEFKDGLTNRAKHKYISLFKFKDEYTAYIKSTKSQNYTQSVEYSFNKLTDFLQLDMPLFKISVKDIENFITTNFQSSKHATALTYRTLKAAFTKAVTWNYISFNPFQKVKLPKIPKPNPAFINELELLRIIAQEPLKDLQDMFILGFHSGMRLSEILNLKWNAVDFINREILVKNTDSFTTKNKRDRIIPINNTLFSMLQGRLPKITSINRDEYVFEKLPGVKYSPFYVSKAFKKASRAAGMNESIHFHSLRHSFISNLIQRGCSLTVAQQLAGHSQISVTRNYAHVLTENLHSAVKLLDGYNNENKQCL